jgi:hypothetical protein
MHSREPSPTQRYVKHTPGCTSSVEMTCAPVSSARAPTVEIACLCADHPGLGKLPAPAPAQRHRPRPYRRLAGETHQRRSKSSARHRWNSRGCGSPSGHRGLRMRLRASLVAPAAGAWRQWRMTSTEHSAWSKIDMPPTGPTKRRILRASPLPTTAISIGSWLPATKSAKLCGAMHDRACTPG